MWVVNLLHYYYNFVTNLINRKGTLQNRSSHSVSVELQSVIMCVMLLPFTLYKKKYVIATGQFITFATEFVTFAIEFIPFAVE